MKEFPVARIDTHHRLKNEKESYKFVGKYFVHRGFKMFSTILRGFPDYVVSDFALEGIPPGFMEVKFEDRELRPSQVKVMQELMKIAPCYVCRAWPDGRLELFKLS